MEQTGSERMKNRVLMITVALILLINFIFYFAFELTFESVIWGFLIPVTVASIIIQLAYRFTHRLQGQLDNRIQNAEILYQAAHTLTSALDLDQVFDGILDQIGKVIAHDSACIFIWEDDSLVAVAAHGPRETNQMIGSRYPGDHALFQQVSKAKRPVILDDAMQDPRFIGWGATKETVTWMGVPLIARDKILGFLTLDSSTPFAYDVEQAKTVQIFASHAANVIENARLYNSAKDSAERQRILHRVGQEMIRAGLDLENIYKSVHKATTQLMPSDAFVISLANNAQQCIEAVYLYDQDVHIPPKQVPLGEGLSGYVIQTGKAVLAFDFFEEDTLKDLGVFHFGEQEHIRSVLAVPMRLGDSTMGMISAQTYQAYDYTDQDQQLLEMLAAYAAIAIDNAHLFEKVQHLARIDSLLGVYNRRYFYDVANKEIERSRRYGHPLSIIMLDLDYYKEINDMHGHNIGDDALKIFAKRCTENIRECDVLARYGGDEFIILLPETHIDQARDTAERLRITMETSPIMVGQTEVSTTISVGLTGTSDEIVPDLNILLKSVDIALYEAKSSGRNCTVSKPYP